jgi:hypothetical protein
VLGAASFTALLHFNYLKALQPGSCRKQGAYEILLSWWEEALFLYCLLSKRKALTIERFQK